MTASTQGLTAQGLAGYGIPSQQGTFTPGFPPAIGAEQYLGTAQQYGYPRCGGRRRRDPQGQLPPAGRPGFPPARPSG